jgi:DNA-binding transcriptional regulator YiaG
MPAVTQKQSAAKKRNPRGSAAHGSVGAAKSGLVLALRKRLQLKQADFAKLLPVSVRSLATLESGSAPTEAVARRLTELQRLTSALSEVLKDNAPGIWLQTPQDAFDGLKPLEVIDRGESDRLWAMIYFLRSGLPA